MSGKIGGTIGGGVKEEEIAPILARSNENPTTTISIVKHIPRLHISLHPNLRGRWASSAVVSDRLVRKAERNKGQGTKKKAER